MSREWRLYVADMKACCERVTQYTSGLGREEFERKRMAYDATLRNLELLGEAARHVPDEVRALAPDIPWRRIVGVRNILFTAISASTTTSSGTSSGTRSRPSSRRWRSWKRPPTDRDSVFRAKLL
ncbi:MAG: HepT-like ribonuclease domain-containing protein [Betaproteobacteria bacterium]